MKKLICAVTVLVFSTAQAATIHVDVNCPGPGNGSEADPYCSIQTAIDNAVDTDEIVVAPGTYFETVNFLGKAITLRSSEGPVVTVIDAQQPGRVVTCTSGEGPNTVLSGFVITGGNAGQGGGMYNFFASPTVTDCTFSGNTADFAGGGMFNDSSSPTVTNCTFSGNSASLQGGGMNNQNSSPTVTNCTFSGNIAGLRGGGMFNYFNSNPTVTDCTFVGNSANSSGGGMYNDGSSPTVTNCTFSNNSNGSGNGVGAGMANVDGSPTVTDCTFTGNTSTHFGGGMYNASSSPTVNNCIFEANFVSGYGGGMANINGSPTVANCTFVSNQARQGGLQNGGGGMYNSHSDAMVTSCVFTFNISSVAGGAMFNTNSACPTVIDCTFNFNTAGTGGAIENDSGDATVVRCRFTGNTAFFGGAIRNLTSSPDFLNCSFIDNSVPLSGGGMFSLFASTPTLTNCTFSGNVGAEGAAIFNDSGTTTVSNSILWGGSSSEIAGSGTTNVTDSAVEGGWPGIGNIDADPLFVDPDNGDFRLSTDSPCIDAGDNTAVPEGVLRDLDGNPRFVADACAGASGATVDMGAYEFQGTSCDLGTMLEMLAAWGRCNDCDTCPADFDGDCSVGILDLLILLGNWG